MKPINIAIGFIAVVVTMALTWYSSSISHNGFEALFGDDIAAAGYIGRLIAVLASICLFFVLLNIRAKRYADAALYFAVSLVVLSADGYSNSLGFQASSSDKLQSYNQLAAEYQHILTLEGDIKAIKDAQADLADPDKDPMAPEVVLRRQNFLKANGYYDGNLDGEVGPMYNRAITAFSRSAPEQIAEWQEQVDAYYDLNGRGEPVKSLEVEPAYMSLIKGMGLTIIISVFMMAGLSAMSIRDVSEHEQKKQELDDMRRKLDRKQEKLRERERATEQERMEAEKAIADAISTSDAVVALVGHAA